MAVYQTPIVVKLRQTAAPILTVSTEADWKEDEWDETLNEEDAYSSSDQA